MRTFTFAAAALCGYTQALRLAAKASHADLLFAEFEAKHNKNYLSQAERATRKELYLKRHEEIVNLHPATSYVDDNWTNDLDEVELDNLHGIDPNTHKKTGPPRQPTLAQIQQHERDAKRQLGQVSDELSLDNPQLIFQYNGMILEARITDLGGEIDDNNNDDNNNDNNNDDNNNNNDDNNNDNNNDDNNNNTNETFPMANCPSGSTECNWLERGAVSPVKNQGGCGSCWAFAAAALTESFWYKNHGPFSSQEDHIDLSEQQDVDCIFGHGGCQGGNSYDSWGLHNERSSQKKVWALESDNPYKGSFQGANAQCDFERGIYVDQHTYYEGDWEDTDLIKNALLKGPVVVYLWASDTVFMNYSGGVITSNCTNSDINHAVLAVGFGHDDVTNEDYFLVKNSWGRSWGVNGYIKIGHRSGNGVCGIQYWNHYQIDTGSSIGL